MYIGGHQLASLALEHINQLIRVALGPVDVFASGYFPYGYNWL